MEEREEDDKELEFELEREEEEEDGLLLAPEMAELTVWLTSGWICPTMLETISELDKVEEDWPELLREPELENPEEPKFELELDPKFDEPEEDPKFDEPEEDPKFEEDPDENDDPEEDPDELLLNDDCGFSLI